MNIAIIKKSAIAALTVAIIATGSLSASTSTASAGGKHFGAALLGGLAIGLIASAARGRGHGYARECWTERQWRVNRYGEEYSVRVRVCN
ncbi:MAG: hypothetical protein JKX93_11690 [Rhizobiaceae bacterium]|nr:hypothetical protein [Rhizobiaceae bacterium]